MKRTLTATLIASLAAPAFAGGPVVIEEAEEVVAEERSGGMLVPILMLLAIGVAVASGGDNEDRYGSRY